MYANTNTMKPVLIDRSGFLNENLLQDLVTMI